MRILISILALALSLTAIIPSLYAQEDEATTLVHIRITDKATGRVSPSMVSIISKNNPSIPVLPGKRVFDTISRTADFYKGISFSKDRNWSGPVRKMNGQGNNDDRSFVYDLMPSLPYWKEAVLYQVSGDFTVNLGPGQWQINTEHGNEYLPMSREFTVRPGTKDQQIELVLQRWIDLPVLGWYSGDVHVHHPTNQPAYRDFLLEYAKAEDIHLVNVLEMGHHKGTEFKQEGFGQKFRICSGNTCLVSGQEDPRSEFGHIIGLNIDEQIRDTSAYNYYDQVFKRLHRQPAALVGYAHFSWNGCDLLRGLPWFITSGGIDFVELLQFGKINTLNYSDYLNLGFRITAAAGSDVPWGSTLGEVRTFVYTGNSFSADKWFEGLRAGNTFVSNGPALFFSADGFLPGSEIQKKTGAELALQVRAVSPVEIGRITKLLVYGKEGILFQKENPGKQDSVVINSMYKINESSWIAAVAYCENGAVAHSTAVYVLADGKPILNKKAGPEIIGRQLEYIQTTEQEEKNKPAPDPGIVLRLKTARAFYQALLEQCRN